MTSKGTTSSLGIVPYIVAGCMFMENLDATVIVAALPTMAVAFGTEPASLSLGISAYMIAVAIFLPLSAWLADRFGTRTVMTAAMAAFVLASLACGFCNDLASFVAARCVQGAAAALMTPAGRTIVLRDTPKTQLVHAISVLTWPALIAPILGPPLGGFLTTFASWRWIFFLNLPIGLIGLVMILRFVPNRKEDVRRPFDWSGFGLTAFALGMLVLGLELFGAARGTSMVGGALLAGGTACAVLAVRHMHHAPHPLIDLAPLRIRSFSVGTITGGTFTRMAIGATPFLLPLMMQVAFGYTAFEAGALTLAYFAGNLGIKTVTTPLLKRFGFRNILTINGALVAITVGACAVAALGPPVGVLAIILVAAGAARSLQFTALNTLAFAEIAPAQSGSANTLLSLTQQISVTSGIVVAALLLQVAMAFRQGETMAANDFSLAFLVMAAIGALGIVSYARLSPAIGAEVSGHGR